MKPSVQIEKKTPAKTRVEDGRSEVIEEIVFHHPNYTSPTTYYNSVIRNNVRPSNLND